MKNNNQNEFQETELEYPQQVRAESLSFQMQNQGTVSAGGTEEERSGVIFPEEADDPENDQDGDELDDDQFPFYPKAFFRAVNNLLHDAVLIVNRKLLSCVVPKKKYFIGQSAQNSSFFVEKSPLVY